MVREKWKSKFYRQWKWNRLRNSQDYRIFVLTTIYSDVLIGCDEIVTIRIDLKFWMPYIDCKLWAPAQYPHLTLNYRNWRWCSLFTKPSPANRFTDLSFNGLIGILFCLHFCFFFLISSSSFRCKICNICTFEFHNLVRKRLASLSFVFSLT